VSRHSPQTLLAGRSGSEMIWSKIGAEHDFQLAVLTQGYPMLCGFAALTLRDIHRFGMIFTPSWNKVSDERIVSESIVHMLQTTGDPAIFGIVGNLALLN
jgi:hypothetical protein